MMFGALLGSAAYCSLNLNFRDVSADALRTQYVLSGRQDLAEKVDTTLAEQRRANFFIGHGLIFAACIGALAAGIYNAQKEK